MYLLENTTDDNEMKPCHNFYKKKSFLRKFTSIFHKENNRYTQKSIPPHKQFVPKVFSI